MTDKDKGKQLAMIMQLSHDALEGFYLWDDKMKKAGLSYKVTRTASRIEEQIALFLQGRAPREVNKYRALCCIPPIPESDCSKIVTWKIFSRHVVWCGKTTSDAWDFVLADDKGRYHYDLKADIQKNQIPDYEEACILAESLGLASGRLFGDYCHIELRR